MQSTAVIEEEACAGIVCAIILVIALVFFILSGAFFSWTAASNSTNSSNYTAPYTCAIGGVRPLTGGSAARDCVAGSGYVPLSLSLQRTFCLVFFSNASEFSGIRGGGQQAALSLLLTNH